MIQGITLAAQGMTTMMQKQDQIANNLANINTTGYKSSSLFTKSYNKYLADDKLRPYANSEIKADEVYIDFSPGTAKITENPLDVMIKGTGFIAIMTADGERYTRNGNFNIDKDHYLVTNDGNKVMNREGGFIKLNADDPIVINDNGELFQGLDEQGTIKVVDFKKPYRLLRDGNSRFKPQLPDNPIVQSGGYILKQGYLEGSNANPVQNMVEMISAFRNFESDQKALQAQDETLDKSVNSVGRIG